MKSDLDTPLMWWTNRDPLTGREARQSIGIFGKTGSGKTSGSGDAILRALVRYKNTGGLILASKPEDKEYIQRVFRQERSLDDLLIMEPEGKYFCNVLEYERSKGADTRQLTQAVMTFEETMSRTQGGREGHDPFWRRENERMVFNAIEVIVAGTGKIDCWDLEKFITGAAISLEESGEAKWQEGFHYQTLLKAWKNRNGDRDIEHARAYWVEEIPRKNDRTRTSIETGALGSMHVLNIGIVRKMIAGDTTITPDVMEERKWILVNMPITPGDASATVVNAAMKYVVQRHILRRKATEKSPLLTIWIDEYQKTGNSFDALALAEIRSHKGCMVVLTQSMHALYSSIRQHGGDHETDSLLTNFGHIIFHTLGDAKSAEYASSLLGQRRELFVGASSTNASMWDVVTGKSGISVNTSETYQPVLQPSAFLSGLRHGGPPHRIVDGIVIKTGEPFHSGENYIFCEFKQK